MHNDETKVARTKVAPKRQRPPALPQTAKGYAAYRDMRAKLDAGFCFSAASLSFQEYKA